MRNIKILKITLTSILLGIFLIPLFLFILYPNYNKLIGPIKRFNVQRSTEEFTFQFLTTLSPTKDKVIGMSDTSSTQKSIEESLSSDLQLTEKILEQQNTNLKISSIDVEGLIYEGLDANTMDIGFWHFPVSSFPGQKGNSVIIGHRYAKLPPSTDTFFNLDKVKVGDKIVVEQLDNLFTYIITDTKVVEKNDISILQNFDDYRLTLITCTPLWSADQRLVIVAKLDKLYKNT
ncbi:MAG: class D sortase [Candidatus Dojkabacteria bacterium]|jgi:LPXTG-site transpeptidase (sortase) family protein